MRSNRLLVYWSALIGIVILTACETVSTSDTPESTSTPRPTTESRPTATVTLTATMESKSTEEIPGGTFGEVTFGDEFDGPEIDTTKWYVEDIHQDVWPETPWRRNFKKENVYIQDGVLVIRITREEDGFSSGAIGTFWIWNHDMGTIDEKEQPSHFEQAFGRFEARMRFPTQQGHWCAFWLWTLSEKNIDGSGRDGTEIDILERAWLIDRGIHALHWDGYGPEKGNALQGVNGMGLDDGGWHVVRLDWYPDQYVFFIDGKETWRTDAGGVCQTPNFIILSVEIGNFGTGPEEWGVGPIEDAVLPDYFYVDYVRVHRYVPPQQK